MKILQKNLNVLILMGVLLGMGACASSSADRDPAALDTDYFQKVWKHFPGTCSSDNRFCTYFTPDDVPVHALARALHSARRSIKIMIYSFSDDTGHYSQIINEKLRAGVKVEFLMDFKNSFDDHRVFNRVSEHPNLTLLRIPVLRGRNPQDHNKVVIVDDEVVYTGSANYSMNGLVGNYEDTLSIKDPSAVAQYGREFEEAKALSMKACQLFRSDPSTCGRTRKVRGFNKSEGIVVSEIARAWNPKLVHMLWNTEGQIYRDMINDNPECRDLWDPPARAGSSASFKPDPKGLFNSYNQASDKRLSGCLRDQAFKDYVAFVSSNEKFADGTSTASVDRPWDYLPRQENEEIEVYFSPEDNLLKVFEREIEESYRHGSQAFIYAAPNFITERNIVAALVKAKESGVRLRLFFDWTRAKDKDGGFAQQLKILDKSLGFTWGAGGEKLKGDITYFNDPLINFGADLADLKKHIGTGAIHTKYMVVGVPQGSGYKITLLGGSTNWSGTALQSNGENLVVIRNLEVGSMYLKNMVSNLLMARYGQNTEGSGFQDELSYLYPKVPCLKALMGESDSCLVEGGRSWKPRQVTSHVVVVEGAPVNTSRERVWAWVPALNENAKDLAIPFFTHEGFMGGRWIGVIPTQKGWDACFKLFKAESWILAPDAQNLSGNDEYAGGENRCLKGMKYSAQKLGPVPVRWGVK